jgi:hypothetical protein
METAQHPVSRKGLELLKLLAKGSALDLVGRRLRKSDRTVGADPGGCAIGWSMGASISALELAAKRGLL